MKNNKKSVAKPKQKTIMAYNPNHQHLVELTDNKADCDCTLEEHGKYSKIYPKNDCTECGGDDPYGEWFCPVCNYCCGC